jgi:hypothetical protein
MRRFKLALGVMAAVLLVAGVSAQNMKDFNGKWTADTEKNGPAPAAGARGGGAAASDFTITMDAKTLNISTMRNGTESKVHYTLDGAVSKNDPPMGRNGGSTTPVESVAKWDGDKVVIVTKGANGDTTVKYFLDGKDLVRESTRPGAAGAEPTTSRTYFKKVM